MGYCDQWIERFTTKNVRHCTSVMHGAAVGRVTIVSANAGELTMAVMHRIKAMDGVDRCLLIVQGLAGMLDGLVLAGSGGCLSLGMVLKVSRYRAWRMIQKGRC